MSEEKILVITADDFGFSQERNIGIIEAFNARAIGSASLLLNCSGTKEAVSLAKSNNLYCGKA